MRFVGVVLRKVRHARAATTTPLAKRAILDAIGPNARLVARAGSPVARQTLQQKPFWLASAKPASPRSLPTHRLLWPSLNGAGPVRQVHICALCWHACAACALQKQESCCCVPPLVRRLAPSTCVSRAHGAHVAISEFYDGGSTSLFAGLSGRGARGWPSKNAARKKLSHLWRLLKRRVFCSRQKAEEVIKSAAV